MKKIFVFLGIFATLLLNAQEHKKVAVVGGLYPLASVVQYWVDDAELIYIPEPSHTAFVNSVAKDIYPNSVNIPYGDSENIEELLKLKADIYVCHKSKTKVCDILANSGVKVISLSTSLSKYNSKIVLKHWLDELAKEFDIKAKNEALMKELEDSEKFIAEKVGNAPKPTAVILHKILPKNEFVVGIFSEYLLSNSGAKNGFSGIEGVKKVGFEDILKINPDIIYISNFTPHLPKDILNKPEFKDIKAVKNAKVYKMPLGQYRPHAPNLDLPVTLKFFAKMNQPEIFKDMDIGDEYIKHFKKFYNADINSTQINQIFNPSIEAGRM